MAETQRETLGKCKCAACGGTATLKLNKNGIAYYYCHQNRKHPRIEGEFFTCNGHQKWGRVDSFAIKMAYLKPANINAAPTLKVVENEPTNTPARADTDVHDDKGTAPKRDDSDPFSIF
ncbi:hypothetical protein G5B38_02380 [Pseudohalocynthiibacter aestuariivivens]|nr:zinc ribbon domain-containing protein [Pseudohalocynthiibacter aestuariivivens]QIE44465.1 hypothetical protein G5B38_02380 [Pseudohalocynthiibacter aestuariivivens]